MYVVGEIIAHRVQGDQPIMQLPKPAAGKRSSCPDHRIDKTAFL